MSIKHGMDVLHYFLTKFRMLCHVDSHVVKTENLKLVYFAYFYSCKSCSCVRISAEIISHQNLVITA